MRSRTGSILSAILIVALAIATYWVFGSQDRQGLSLRAASPLPTPTVPPPRPTFLPSDLYSDPMAGVDSGRPAPTPDPRDFSKPTGGPYITEEKAIEIALSVAKRAGRVDPSSAPRATFTTADRVNSVIGDPRPQPGISRREMWVVEVSGGFDNYSRPPEAPAIIYPTLHAILDATTGRVLSFDLRK